MDYIKRQGLPQTLDELNSHQLIGNPSVLVWHLTDEASAQQKILYPKLEIITNDISLMTQFVCDGLGMVLLPMSQVNTQINNGLLHHVLPQWRGPERELFAVWPSGRLLSVKAKCLREYMKVYINDVWLVINKSE
ncbi:LysR substrate-binding domain-containing protein [Shewanella surugensis]|uniref:LysR substrate-binding domain-containing protein n=1 Tax=Shewanella surugensis TaxID=212020 RepID=A0ABT0L9J9_9GAMM|nr:LysR substrate-binding domain-containing protein [Shewanella surugensis]MCL1124348.1 LysR substrate-binding domain-containing protein [Shewanella surugensis]